MVVEDITNQLNGLAQTANGTFVMKDKKSNSATNQFINAMVKGLVGGVGVIVDDIINPKDRRKR